MEPTQETIVEKKNPPKWLPHLAAITVHVLFGIGNCVGKEALKSMPAIIFAFYRELFAGLVLLAITLLTRSQLVKRCHWKRLFLVGLCMFGNQVFFIVGLSFAPAHVASIWQTTQPIITVVITIILHMETRSALKIGGVLLATAGAMVVTWFSGGGTEGKNILLGSLFFFINCVSSSLFVIVSKALVQQYPALSVTSLAYNICSVMVMIVGLVMYGGDASAWSIPKEGIWCLLYYVFIHSITTYFLMVWCNRYIDASIISAYSTFQPVSTTIVAVLFLHEVLNWGDMGVFLILLGLALVIYDSYKSKFDHAEPESSNDQEALLIKEEVVNVEKSV